MFGRIISTMKVPRVPSTGPQDNSISGGTLLVADGGSDVALVGGLDTLRLLGTLNTPGGMQQVTSQRVPRASTILLEISKRSVSRKTARIATSLEALGSGGLMTGNWASQAKSSSGSPLFDQNHRIVVNCLEVLLHVQEASTMVLTFTDDSM